MRAAGLAVELIETRHARNAFKTMPVKTDRKDAQGIAKLMRLGWFRPVHCKSMAAQETRANLTAGKLLQSKLHDVEMSLRGVKRAYMRSIGITDADFGSRLLGPFIDKVAEFEARTSRAAAPVLCRVGEEKFGAQGTLWPRLLEPAQ
jgi:transposase